MRLIHLTDPHLSRLEGLGFSLLRGKRWSGYLSWRKNRQKKYLPAVLEKLTAAVKAQKPDQILLTGDLVQIGLEHEIQQAAQWLTGLAPANDVMLVPGNHDIYAGGSEAVVHDCWSEYLFHDAVPGHFPTHRKFGKLSLIGLSSACVSPLFMATGKLEQDQLQALTVLLEKAADEQQLVCLLIHHPPLPQMAGWRKSLTNARALQDVLGRHPPALIFHGHLHHNREQQWGESRIFCTAAASSVSDASYRVIDIEDDGQAWSVHMALKSVDIENTGGLGFVTVDEQSWMVSK
jgi:3',5'-cyclic AMP phosphodiesterase CpdA